MIPTKNPQEEDLNDLSIFYDPYTAAINPETRPVLQCLDCGQNGAVHLPRYGDGDFCNIDCRDNYHLTHYNEIFHGDIPKPNITDIKKVSETFAAIDSPTGHFIAAAVIDPNEPQAEAESDAESHRSASTDVSSDVTRTDDGMNVEPPPADEDFADGQVHPCMHCGSMTLGDWGQGLILGSFCNQECQDIWHKEITARQAASKLKYDNRQPIVKVEIDESEMRQCFYCLQMTPDYLTMCDKSGRCKYHPDGGEITETSKETFQRLMELAEGLIRPANRQRRDVQDYGMIYPQFTVKVKAAQHSYSASATFRRKAVQHHRQFVKNQPDDSVYRHGRFTCLEDWWHSLPDKPNATTNVTGTKQ